MNTGDSAVDHSHSVTRWIAGLKGQDPHAASQIWKRFFDRLLPLAKARLRTVSDRTVDEEDILVSVFDRFFKAAREERFARLDDRDDLWQILLMLTDRKVTEQYRRAHAQKRGGGQVSASVDLGDAGESFLRNLADTDPGPEFVAAFNEGLARALTRLEDDKAREVALLKLEGVENKEIVERVGISLSSVERKLRMIREVWDEEFGNS